MREGLEDFEYFCLHAQAMRERGEADPAERSKEMISTICRSLVDFTKEPGDMYAVRRRVAEEIIATSK